VSKNQKLFIGDPHDPTIFELKETHSRLDGTVWFDKPPVYQVRVYSMNDLDYYDPIIGFESEYVSYHTALLAFSAKLVDHASFLVDYHNEPQPFEEVAH
jgi:hypothetical protein